MMKKLLSFLLSVWLLHMQAYTQESFYWSKDGNPISLTENQSSLCLYFINPVQTESLKFSKEVPITEVRYSLGNGKKRVIVDFDQNMNQSPMEMVNDLGIDPRLLKSASWGRLLQGEMDMWLTHRVLYDKKEGIDPEKVQAIWSKYRGARAGKFSTGYSYIDLEDIEEVISLSNQLYESGTVKWAHPNFAVVVKTQSLPDHNPVKVQADSFPTDSLFHKLFYLHNTGQNPLSDLGFWQGGVADVDIDAPEAWGIETGSSTITVAIVDQGVQDHEDLNDAGGSSRIIAGYTADNTLIPGGVPQTPGAAHGEGVAGVIAASHNAIGVAGICPECKLISATAFIDAGDVDNNDPTEIQYLANSINWAWQNGGDVINNSWVLEICTTTSGSAFANIEAAIDDAKTLGRSGKGCVIIFASGQYVGSNEYPYDCVAYPATLPQVIAVGAIDLKGEFPAYANYGPELDVVAPTSRQVGTVAGQGMENSVSTIDLYPDGYNHPTANLNYANMKYNRYFGGTSVASSVASGIVALILSRNPGLTATEVSDILINSSTDVNSAGFDNLSGHGMVNAHDALLITPSPTLPVEYLSFTGKALNKQVKLTWETAQEVNNDFFVLEKKMGNTFQPLGQIAGAGTANHISSYTFTDVKPQLGNNIYRLRQVDIDGQIKYSHQVEVTMSADDLGLFTRLYPNPGDGELNLEIVGMKRSELRLSIRDLQGRVLKNEQFEILQDKETIRMNTSELSTGTYLVELHSHGAKLEVLKFVIFR